MEDVLPFVLAPRIKCLQSQLCVQRLIILGSYDFIQIVACRVRARPVMPIDANDVSIPSTRKMICGADAKGASTKQCQFGCWTMSLLLYLRSNDEDRGVFA